MNIAIQISAIAEYLTILVTTLGSL